MDEDLGLGSELGVLYAPGAGVQESRDILVVGGLAERPEEAGGDFVADGDDFDVDLFLREGVADAQCVLVDLIG